MEKKMQIDTTFLNELAKGTAVPGGGSAASYAGAMAAGLVVMVTRLTQGKKKYADVEDRMVEIERVAEEYRAILTRSVQEDSEAFTAVMAAYQMPKETESQVATRKQAVQAATLQAIKVPYEVAQTCVKVLELAGEVAKTGNANAITDAGTGAVLANAAFNGAVMNVQINLTSLEDKEKVEYYSAEVEKYKWQVAFFMEDVRKVVKEKIIVK
jgi:formiminotetrahydrofolate cyclodeaminase